jgi:hypothetical protein
MALEGKFMDKMKIHRKCPHNPVKEKIEENRKKYKKINRQWIILRHSKYEHQDFIGTESLSGHV